MNKADKALPESQSALQEPHDQDVMGQADSVGIKFERVGKRQGNGKNGEVSLV